MDSETRRDETRRDVNDPAFRDDRGLRASGRGEFGRDGHDDDEGHRRERADRDGSPEEIEREIDRTRARLEGRIDALQERLSVRALSEDFMALLSGGAGTGSRRIIQGVRNNPVPAALVGLGVAWLLIDRYASGGGRGPGIIGRMRGRQVGGYGEREWLAPGAEYTPGEASRHEAWRHEWPGDRGTGSTFKGAGSKVKGAAGKVGEWAKEAGEGVSSAASSIKETARDLGGSVRGAGAKVGEWAGEAKEKASELGHKARRTAGRAGEAIAETYESNPLVVGAAALALGVLAGLAAPTTRTENRLMGRASRRVKETAKRAGEKGGGGGERGGGARGGGDRGGDAGVEGRGGRARGSRGAGLRGAAGGEGGADGAGGG